jgi:acetyl esterase
MKSNAEGYLLERRDLHWCWHHYLASEADRHNPYAEPARATSLTGLPPTLIITAEFDPLRDQARAFGERLKREGVPSKVSNYAGVMHAFVEYEQLDQAPAALAETAAFLRRAWDREPGLCP